MTIEECVEEYIRQRRNPILDEMSFYAGQPTLFEATKVAVSCKRANGKRHTHQRRIPKVILGKTERKLLAVIDELKAARDFDTLHSVVNHAIRSIRGIGELTVYDLALRIGAFLDLKPNVVYLHAGTRTGAAALGLSGESIRKEELPDAFAPLSEAEIEDCLCIYKDVLRGSGRTAARCGDSIDVSSCFSTSAHRSRPC